ncbi:hypothetical protein CB0940_07150 [Cercospora beticola]|uniref:Quinate/shikimate 5-dehydrogenase/glutamyl-tRNA reductase domain-containing protein n=1 Tax=Cercospora beticola TaxID=122368 RepID=A0A2G5H8F5_CERBT|nr:hypothetical protein CB0940_07150 [Cercospora beticola]PIA88815.1 hypothetical protein CB0940_07150 [Cercospora beticola]WPB03077.1 hypothetical protein RHO25_007714 [Cercospora beticola]CAK1358218.1 unnamed protein product [Cercospora beticola]
MLILPDSAIRTLLHNLTKQETLHFQQKLQTSLQGFSSSEKQHQPSPGITTRPNGQKTLFRPFTSPSSVGCKIIVDPAPDPNTGTKDVLHGVLVVCDEKGLPKGLINAEEVTSFRTALCSLIPWVWRKRTRKVVVFGAGKVGVWTVRLCLRLRGEEVESVVVVNRNKGRAEDVVGKVEPGSGGREGLEIKALGSEDEEEVRKALREADAVFCTVPSEAVLFDEKDVRREDGQSKPYISAIGSWRPNLIELDPELLKRVVSEEKMYNPVSQSDDGFILVDDRKSVAEHTGELLRSKLTERKMIEVGQMLEIRENLRQSEEAAKLNAHLEEGFLIYKSVGVSVTDLASGEAILELAQKQGNLGTVITDF